MTWQNKGMIEIYVKDCCGSCQEAHAVVKEYKECKVSITRITKQISSALLLRVDKNQIYETGVFEKRQQAHRNAMFAQFEASFQKIMGTLRHINSIIQYLLLLS